jgi:beta-glucosidase
MLTRDRYNRINGTYVADDARLINGILRKEWGFDGLVMSDWMGTYSTSEGVNAGVDLEMPGPSRWRGEKLLQALKLGQVSEGTIDCSARRVLKLLKALNRYGCPDEAPEYEAVNQERDEFIAHAAAEGVVLLKNEGSVLPLPANAKVAVIGHLARVTSLGGGGSAKVNSLRAVTPLDGLDRLGVHHTFEPGVPVFGAVPHAEPIIVSQSGSSTSPGKETKPVKLEWFNGSKIGQNLVHSEMLPNAEYMIKEVWPQYLIQDYCTKLTFDITPQTTGDHTLSVISTGPATVFVNGKKVFYRDQEPVLVPESFYFFKPKIERRFTQRMFAGQKYTLTLESWAAKPEVIAEVKGRVFQGSALRFVEYVDVAGSITNAATTAEKSDVAVVFVGTTNEIESEGYDRETMDLSSDQYDLIHAVAAKNPKTVVVNLSGAPVSMIQFHDLVPAIVQGWFPGQECGHSIARVLTGKVNPGGRLPMSWPRKIEDNPSYGNFPVDDQDVIRYEEGLNVGYRYYDREDSPKPLFPFGFGLSYTTFEVSDANVSAAEMSGVDGTIHVTCRAKNTGQRYGKLAVQLYVQSPSISKGQLRPLKELKAFTKIGLAEGQSEMVSMKLDKYSVSFYDESDAVWRAQKGTYTVLVGTSAADITTRASFTIPEDFIWLGL